MEKYKQLADAELVDMVLREAAGPAVELAERFAKQDTRPELSAPRAVVDQVSAEIRKSKKEHFVAFYVDARSRLICSEVVSIGTLSASLVHPREVFRPAIANSAAGVIVVHNHPSGDCTPSSEDCEATRRLRRAGELLGIPVLDHVIVSARSFLSFKEQGLLS